MACAGLYESKRDYESNSQNRQQTLVDTQHEVVSGPNEESLGTARLSHTRSFIGDMELEIDIVSVDFLSHMPEIFATILIQ